MKKKLSALTDEALVSACVARAESGSSFVDSNLAAERREVLQYYQGKKPFPLREGGSRFVSQDVYLAVEADRKSTRLNSSHVTTSRMPSSA